MCCVFELKSLILIHLLLEFVKPVSLAVASLPVSLPNHQLTQIFNHRIVNLYFLVSVLQFIGLVFCFAFVFLLLFLLLALLGLSRYCVGLQLFVALQALLTLFRELLSCFKPIHDLLDYYFLAFVLGFSDECFTKFIKVFLAM